MYLFIWMTRYVENLPEDTTVDVLNDVFKRYGVIVTNLDGTPKVCLDYGTDDRSNCIVMKREN